MGRKGKDHFAEFDEHTLLKHHILRAYLESWARKLLHAGTPKHARAWFVDGFAGEGRDGSGNSGSPLIAAEIAFSLLEERGPTPGGGAPMVVLAIESKPANCKRLQEALQPFASHSPPLARVHCGTMSDKLNDIVRHAKNDPILFFLDPFGLKGIVGDQLPVLLSGSRNEMFVLFSDMGAIRLHATLQSTGGKTDYEIQRIRETPSLFEEFDAEAIASATERGQLSDAALHRTQESALRILGEILGEEAVATAASIPRDERGAFFTETFMRRLQAAGAQYVISLPVRKATNSPAYQLVFATKSAVGMRTMKEAMHTGISRSGLPVEVKDAIVSAMKFNVEQLLDEVRRHFAGQEVRWSLDYTPSVRRYLLEETVVFPWQLSEVQAGLVEHRIRARPITYRLPAR